MNNKDQRSMSGPLDEIEFEPLEDSAARANRIEKTDTNAMLAEVSFMEGEELLARGDRANAVSHFRAAVNYTPNNVGYIVKLAELLTETPNSRIDAAKLLERAIELSPNDGNLRMKLNELRENKVRRDLNPPTPKKGTARIKENIDEVELINKEIKDLEKSQPDQMRDLKRRTESLTYDLSNKGRDGKEFRNQLIKSSDTPLPSKISSAKWLVLTFMIMCVLGGVAYRMLPATELKLISPSVNAVVDAKEINFKWNCKRTDIFYVVEVYEQGDLVMKQIVKGDSYAPDDTQKSVFRADQNYTWLVKTMPNSELGYDLQSEIKTFKIGTEFPAPPITPPTAKQQTEDEPPPPPRQRPDRKESHDTY